MNRVVVLFDSKGAIAEVVADTPVKVLFVDPALGRERVFD